MEDSITCICLTPDDQSFFVSDKMGFLKQYSILEKKMINLCGKILKYAILAMAVSPNFKYLFIGGKDGLLKEWTIKTNKISKDFKNHHDSHITSLFVTTDGQFQLTADIKGYIKQMNISAKALVKTYLSSPAQTSPFVYMKLSSEGKYLFTTNHDTELIKWRFSSHDSKDRELFMEEQFGKIVDEKELAADNVSFDIY